MSEEKVEDVVVLGGGSFGTALGQVLARKGHSVTILTRDPRTEASINNEHKNPKYLTDLTLHENLKATTNSEILRTATLIVHAIPVQGLPLLPNSAETRDYLKNLAPLIQKSTVIVSASKGIHATDLNLMSDILPSILGADQPLAFFSGPSFARELILDIPTAVVVAASTEELARRVQLVFLQPTLRVYHTTDVTGVEVGGALKNIFAIAAGVSEGLGLGLNTLAALVTRGCSEMTRMGARLGARPETLSGLSGIGDLMLTCYGALSRNRTFGKRLGQGETMADILASTNEVCEGVATAYAAHKLATLHRLDLPIVAAVVGLLDGQLTAAQVARQLMTLPVDKEHDIAAFSAVPSAE